VALRHLSFVFAATAPAAAFAVRTGPPIVAPVVHDGVRLEAPNKDGRVAYVEAWSEATGQRLSVVPAFTNWISPFPEEGVQRVYIASLGLRDGTLVVTDERGQEYHINPKTGRVAWSPLQWAACGAALVLAACLFVLWSRRRSRVGKPGEPTLVGS